mgnify:CR=1 FL=1
MKRVCKDCLHFDFDEGRALCLFHNCTNQCIGCDDFWPKDGNPRCDECRFATPTSFEYLVCHHTAQPLNDEAPYNPPVDWFCENWRARG